MMTLDTKYIMQNQESASAKYAQARHRAWKHALVAGVQGRRNTLLSLEEVKTGVSVTGEHYKGVQQVPVRSIVGSTGRHRDFDGHFNPKTEHTSGRWISVANAYMNGIGLPPVQLLKIGDAYVVTDGNHRVSVARHFGIEYIDAEITEYITTSTPRQAVVSHGNEERRNWRSWTQVAHGKLDVFRKRLIPRELTS
jgi:hypothetical protein